MTDQQAKPFEAILKEWMAASGQYADDTMEDMKSVCLDGDFNLRELAEKLIASERERCAKVADEIATKYEEKDQWPEDRTLPEHAAREISTEIRRGA